MDLTIGNSINSMSSVNFGGLNVNKVANKIKPNVSNMAGLAVDTFTPQNAKKVAKVSALASVPIIAGIINKKAEKANQAQELPFVETPVTFALDRLDIPALEDAYHVLDALEKNKLPSWSLEKTIIEAKSNVNKKTNALTQTDLNAVLRETEAGRKSVQQVDPTFEGNLVASSGVGGTSLDTTLAMASDIADGIQTAGGIIHNTDRLIEGFENGDSKTIAKGLVGLADNTLGHATRENIIEGISDFAFGIGGPLGKIAAEVVLRVGWGIVRDKVVDKLHDFIES